MQTIGQVIPALGLIVLSAVGCQSDLAILCLIISVGFNGASYSGFEANQIDLSPNYAGTLMGIGNMFGNMCGFIAPYVAGILVNDNQTLEAWGNVFLISAGVYMLCNAIFALLGSTKVEEWNDSWKRETKCIEKPSNQKNTKVRIDMAIKIVIVIRDMIDCTEPFEYALSLYS